MSRALDASVKRAIRNGDHEESFERISAVLESARETYLEIEILPKSHVLDMHSHLVQDGAYVGIPKPRLVQAFLHARQILLDCVVPHNEAAADERVVRATAVMLLMDSEHLTAANTRKRALMRGSTCPEGRRRQQDLLTREACFINSLLRSRLHRHTKSAVLWNHKRWLWRQMRDRQMPSRLGHEFEEVICVAAERHPRNYYAWTYARDVIAAEATPTTTRQATAEVADSILPVVTRWCRLHRGDISGWSFLLHLAEVFPDKARGVAEDTLALVEKFRWTNEAVWYLLRNLALMPGLRTEREGMAEVWTRLKTGAGGDAVALDRAAAWAGFGQAPAGMR